MNITLIFSALSLILCVFFFFYFRKYIKRKTDAEQRLDECRTEVYRLIAEIDAATDRDSLLVEERIKTLKTLLSDTDRRIAVYLRELDRSRTGEALYTSLGRGIRTALNPPSEADAGQQNPPAQAAPPAAPVPQEPESVPQKAARALPAAPAPQQEETVRIRSGRKRAAVSGDNSITKPRLKVQIAELAAEGLSPAQIASRLEISFSEVELALNLLSRR
ncbi:MAG: hypothetical protein LBH97_03455 [Treponema sp.]|jgi:hypothetical protein|nr:hypothetical protein [Treponema sp.]